MDSIKNLNEVGLSIANSLWPNKEVRFGQAFLHKTFIRVDEKGSEAAAVTSIMMKATSMPIQVELRLGFDRPFFYATIDREARIPLSMGTIKNPLAK